MAFDRPEQAQQFLDEAVNADAPVSNIRSRNTLINRCMVEGQQWIPYNGTSGFGGNDPNRPRYTNMNPDTTQLIATINEITKLVHETSAMGFMDRLELEIPPGDLATDIEASRKATVMEAATNAMVNFTGYVSSARDSNYRRCVDGTYCMGWDIVINKRPMNLRGGGTELVDDQVLKAFSFPSTELTLDPANQKRELNEHDYVIHSSVWPVQKLRRGLGVEVNEAELQTCGELMGNELYANAISAGLLYANMVLYSRTKGARVFQIHKKDEHGRFSSMLVGYRTGRREMKWVNFDNQDTPFGGCGLPFVMFHGYRRPESMWSVSDVSMLKDHQRRLNLLNTFFYRMLQSHAGAQWLISQNSMKSKDSDESKNQFNNRVYGQVVYDPGTKDRPNPPPQLVKYADPPPFIQQAIERGREEMRDQVHRPDITAGGTKTHVPNSSYQSALQGANQVLGGRSREDITAHEWMLNVGLGTVVKLAQEGSPSILGHLQRAGLDESDFAALSQADPYYPVDSIVVRESSIKYESKEQKEERLWKAVQLQAMPDPIKLRMALAALGIPLDEDDKDFFQFAQKATQGILMGQEWQPIQLGEYASMFITSFQRAIFSKRAQNDPETRDRLDRAINSQMQAVNTATQAQATAEQPIVPPEENPQEQQAEGGQEEGPSEADLGQLLQAIQAGSQQGQPAAAA